MKLYRKEEKYLIKTPEIKLLKNELIRFMDKDPHSYNDPYRVRTLYFDTIFNDDLMDKLSGEYRKRKFRIRIYNNSDYYISNDSLIQVSKPGFNTQYNPILFGSGSSEKIPPIIITESKTVPALKDNRKIVIWSPKGTIWDSNISLLDYSGEGRDKINPIIDYTDRRVLIDITSNFNRGDSLTIKDLRIKNIEPEVWKV